MQIHKGRLSAYAVYLIYSGGNSLFFALCVTVNLVYQVEVAHLNPLQLVLVGTALETVSFLAQVPTGVLADAYSRRLAVILGTLIVGLGFIVEGSIPRFETIMLAQGLFGIGVTFTDGAEQAWISDEVGEAQVGRVFMRSAQMGLLGGLIGAILSAGLASIRLNLPLIIGGSLYVVMALFLLVAMPEQHFRPASEEERQSWRTLFRTFRSGMLLVRGSTILLILLGVQLFFGLSSEGFDRLSTAHFLADFTFPTLWHLKPVAWFGVFSVVETLLSLALSELLRRRLDINSQRVAIFALLLMNALGVGCILVFALTGNFLLAAAAYLSYGVLRGLGRPFRSTWITQSTHPRYRATIFSLIGQVDSLGQIAGGPPVGYIGAAFSLRAALVSVSIILSPVLLLFAWALRKTKKLAVPGDEEETVIEPV